MATPLQILAGIIARPAQVADRFLLWRRRSHFCQQARPQQLRQLARVAAIHAVADCSERASVGLGCGVRTARLPG
jgi:hypothetical protein